MNRIEPEIEPDKCVGVITHYYDRIGVAVVVLSKELTKGENIRIAGGKASFDQTVDSMEIRHQQIERAQPGFPIGLKVNEPVRKGDKVYYII